MALIPPSETSESTYKLTELSENIISMLMFMGSSFACMDYFVHPSCLFKTSVGQVTLKM